MAFVAYVHFLHVPETILFVYIQLFDYMSMTVLANSVSKDNRNSNSYMYI